MLKLLITLLSLTVFLSCLVTPAVYSLLLLLWPDFPWPYSRVFDRVVLVVAVLLLLCRRRELRIPVLRLDLRGWVRRNWWAVSVGFLLSLVGSVSSLYAAVETGALTWTMPSASTAVSKLLKAALTASIVSVVEEVLFRAVMYQRLAFQMGHWRAALLSSAVYAVVHFIVPVKSFSYPGWSPFVGFEYLFLVLGNLTAEGVWKGLIGLFLVGVTLADSVRRSGNLALAIGLHAGWIMALKSSLFLTEVPAGVVFAQGLGRRYFFVAQPATWMSVLVVWGFVVFVTRRCVGMRRPESELDSHAAA